MKLAFIIKSDGEFPKKKEFTFRNHSYEFKNPRIVKYV